LVNRTGLVVGCGALALLSVACCGGLLSALFLTEGGRQLQLEVRCGTGDDVACVALADSYLSEPDTRHRSRALEVLDGSCGRGAPMACRRLLDQYLFGPAPHVVGAATVHALQTACEGMDSGTGDMPCGVWIGPLACRRMGELYAHGTPWTPADARLAVAFYVKAAEVGDAVSIRELARRYETGDGVEPGAYDVWIRLTTACYERAEPRVRVDDTGRLDYAPLESEAPSPVTADDLRRHLLQIPEPERPLEKRVLVGWSAPARGTGGCARVEPVSTMARETGIVIPQPIGDPDEYRAAVLDACRQVSTLPAPPTPPPPPAPPPPPSRDVSSGIEHGIPPDAVRAVRVGGSIKEPKRLGGDTPLYPDIAKQARVQGVVILEATISPQGRVTDIKVLRGIPLLDQAAIDAVETWTYTPTLLNGVPVPVIMTVTVNFKLQ